MRLLITGGCGFLGHHLAKRAKSNGFEVTTLDRSGSPDIRAELPSDCPDLSSFEVVVHLAFEPHHSSLAVTKSLFTNLSGSENLKRVFMVNPVGGASRGALARANVEYAKALSEDMGVPLTVVKSATVFGMGGSSLVDGWVFERGTLSNVPRGTFQIVPVSFFCDYMSEILPATDWLPPNNELVISTLESYSRQAIARWIASMTGSGPISLVEGQNEEALNPLPASEAYGLPICPEDLVFSEIESYVLKIKNS